MPLVAFGAAGDIDPSFAPILNSSVSAICLQPDGKIVVGGSFSNVNGSPCNGIARLNSDGSLDGSFQRGPAGTNSIYAVAVQPDGKILIGGNFVRILSTNRNGIARLNADGTLDNTFDPGTGIGGLHAAVRIIALQTNGAVLIAGNFFSVNGVTRNNFARLNSDGSLDQSFAPNVNLIESMAVQPDGKILLGGQFSSVNGVTCNSIARLDSDGNLDGTFASNPGVGHDVLSMALQPDGKILIGGGMVDSFYGISLPQIARLNADGTVEPGFDPGTGPAGTVAAIILSGAGEPIIGGGFLSVDGSSRVRLARLEEGGGVDRSFDPGNGLSSVCKPFCPSVSTVAVQPDGKILVGGSFSNTNGLPHTFLVRLFGDPLPVLKSVTRHTDGCVSLSGVAATNAQLRLEASINMRDWLPIAQLTNAEGAFGFTDRTATNCAAKFYRAVWLP